MTPVPLTLPLRPSEAAELANLVFELAERRPLTDDVRNRIAARLIPLRLESLTPHMGSLARDPVHHSTCYVAVDTAEGPEQLLHMALATAPISSVSHNPLLIGRVRRATGPEVVINAIPFGPSDLETLEKFVGRVDNAFVPRPQGSRSAIVVAATADAETEMASAFEAFRKILKRTGKNLAAIETAPQDYDTGLWAAVRAGWRDGYSAGVAIRAGEATRETIREAARFTRFRIDAASLVVNADGAVDERFETGFSAEERGWIFDELARSFDVGGVAYSLAAEEAVRMAVRFGPALKACERQHEWIREARSAMNTGKGFDVELALPNVSAQELLFCLHWLQVREHPAQSFAPGAIGEADLEAKLRELSAIGRQYACLLTLDSGEGQTDAALEAIARATAGRVNFRLTRCADDINRIAEVLFG